MVSDQRKTDRAESRATGCVIDRERPRPLEWNVPLKTDLKEVTHSSS